jgi:hypothetical protein
MRDESTRTASTQAASVQAVPMKDLLASCAAARAVSTPPPVPDDTELPGRIAVPEIPADMPERPFGTGEAA